MPVVTEHAPGAPCWFELASTDQNAAKQFYSQIFGWTVTDFPMGPAGTYTMFSLGGHEVAAACTVQQPGIPAHWLTYFNAPDIDATAAKAAQIGGTLVAGPFDVAEYGRMAVLRDPEGAAFALWKARTKIGAQRINEDNTIGWSELLSADNAAAARFYSDLLAVFVNDHKTAGDAYIEFGVGKQHMGGFLKKEAGMDGIPSHWSFYVGVPDADRIADQVRELGGKVRYGPFTAPGVGRIAMLADPQGAAFNVITLNEAA